MTRATPPPVLLRGAGLYPAAGFQTRPAPISNRRQLTKLPHRSARPRRESGYALLLVFVLTAMIAISMYSALPRLLFEAQRQKEQLLIDRGEQYSLAIRRFYAKTTRYPATLDELEKFQGVRFLRRRYKDPMSPSGEWRIVHVNPMGMMTDSKIQKAGQPGLPGQTGQTAAQSSTFGTLQGSTLGNSLAGSMPGQNVAPNAADPNAAAQQQPMWARRSRVSETPGAAPANQGDPNAEAPQETQYAPDPNAQILQQQLQQQQQQGDQAADPLVAQQQQLLQQQQQLEQQQQPQQQQLPGFPPPAPGAPQQQQPAPVAQPGFPPVTGLPTGPAGQPFSGGNPPLSQGFPGMNPQPAVGMPVQQQQNSGAVNAVGQQIMNRLTTGQNAAGIQQGGNGLQAGQFGGGLGQSPGGGGRNANNSPFSNASGPMIAGVASKSEGEGIKIYNDHTKYDEWEFVFDFRKLLQKQAQGNATQNGGRSLQTGTQPLQAGAPPAQFGAPNTNTPAPTQP